MKKIKLVIIILILPLIALKCKKKDDETRWEQPLDPAFLEYVYFKKGTWWTYEDTVTGAQDHQEVVYDSIVIKGPFTGKHNEPGVNKQFTKHYEYHVHTTLRTNLIRFYGSTICGRSGTNRENNNCYLARYNNFSTEFGDGPASCPYFLYQPKFNAPIASSTKSMIKKQYDSIDIINLTYPDVYLIYVPENPQENEKDTRIWISKNHGIIRKAVKIDDLNTYPSGWQVWDLVNYHIVQ